MSAHSFCKNILLLSVSLLLCELWEYNYILRRSDYLCLILSHISGIMSCSSMKLTQLSECFFRILLTIMNTDCCLSNNVNSLKATYYLRKWIYTDNTSIRDWSNAQRKEYAAIVTHLRDCKSICFFFFLISMCK